MLPASTPALPTTSAAASHHLQYHHSEPRRPGVLIRSPLSSLVCCPAAAEAEKVGELSRRVKEAEARSKEASRQARAAEQHANEAERRADDANRCVTCRAMCPARCLHCCYLPRTALA
jgi:hypothetical protein